MTGETLKRAPHVQIERQVEMRHGHVSDVFAGYAVEVTVDGPVMTIDAKDANGVRFIVTVTKP